VISKKRIQTIQMVWLVAPVSFLSDECIPNTDVTLLGHPQRKDTGLVVCPVYPPYQKRTSVSFHCFSHFTTVSDLPLYLLLPKFMPELRFV